MPKIKYTVIDGVIASNVLEFAERCKLNVSISKSKRGEVMVAISDQAPLAPVYTFKLSDIVNFAKEVTNDAV
jgi:hypothetical protein